MKIQSYQWLLELMLLLGQITHAKSFVLFSKFRQATCTVLGEEFDDSQKRVSDILQKCAKDRSAKALDVISILENLEKKDTFQGNDLAVAIDGKFELIFSSAVANIPLIGNMLGGYMPNREIITFDLENKKMSLVVELLPFLPPINVHGDSLVLNDDATLEYTVRGKEGKPPSQWKILYADDDTVAARSSVTGLNVIRRLS